MTRQSGVLLHISSLPNQFGIGSFGKTAYDFVDFLVETHQSYWQILPLGPTSYGDSPYQSFSAFAGNTHFIDFDLLVEQGLLQKEDYANLNFGDNENEVDYARIYAMRRPILEKAVANFSSKITDADYQQFLATQAEWLESFCEYMAIKEHFDLKPWFEWPEDVVAREDHAISELRHQLSQKLSYHRITQYLFYKQWMALKEYANTRHIDIIGDMPIYVAADSVEMWTTPHFFKTDEDHQPTVVAGCPPDAFTAIGQLWGNPIYDWKAMEKDHYAWWVKRISASLELFDMVRIDHFRGFESYWEIPANEETAVNGEWVKGPGYQLFKQVHDELGDVNIIAEDLGFMTDEVIEMRDATGFPGMKILQFGFEPTIDSTDLPHHYTDNTIAYVGTHDNETALGWYNDSATPDQREFMDTYLNRGTDETVSHAMNRGIAATVSKLAIYTMQDLLDLDNRARMNTPSTLGGNWQWRFTEDAITPDVKKSLLDLTLLYKRGNSAYSKKV